MRGGKNRVVWLITTLLVFVANPGSAQEKLPLPPPIQDMPGQPGVPDERECLTTDPDGTAFELSLFVDPRGGDACTGGLDAGSYVLIADDSNRVYFSCYDRVQPRWRLFKLNPGDPGYEEHPSHQTTPEFLAHQETLERSYASEQTTYCAKLVNWSAPDKDIPLPARRRLRLHGVLPSRKPHLTFQISGLKVRVLRRRACCTESNRCLGIVTGSGEACPDGSSPAGPSTDCSACRQLDLPPDESPTRACCVRGSCDSLLEQDCALLNGHVLPAGVECSALQNPCEPHTGACIASNGECAELLTEAECLAIDHEARFLLAQACPEARGGCCDPMGICRTTTPEECPPSHGVFHPEGCPSVCEAQTGACTLPCPNEFNLSCMESTLPECQRRGGTGFSTSRGCPDDPVLLLCEKPPCYECRDLAEVNRPWPTLGGELRLFYERNECAVEFLDGGGVRTGTWSCDTEAPRRRVPITWSDETTDTLVEVVDGPLVRLIPEVEPREANDRFPCTNADLAGEPSAVLKTRVSTDRLIKSGNNYCSPQKYFYGVQSKGFITMYRYDAERKQYEYHYRMRIDSRSRDADGATVLRGHSIDDRTGEAKTEWSMTFE